MSDTPWIECSDRLPPVGALVEAKDRNGQRSLVTVRRDTQGRWADPGHPCTVRYFDKDDHLVLWRLVEPQPDVPATKYPEIVAVLDVEIEYRRARLEAVTAERAAMNGPMEPAALAAVADRAVAVLAFEQARGFHEVPGETERWYAVLAERAAIDALLEGGE